MVFPKHNSSWPNENKKIRVAHRHTHVIPAHTFTLWQRGLCLQRKALHVNVSQEILTNRHWLGMWQSTLFSQLTELFFSDYSSKLLPTQNNIKLIHYIWSLFSPSVIAFSCFTCTENGVLDYKWTIFCVTTLVKSNQNATYWNITRKEN